MYIRMYDGLANTYILVQSCEASIYDQVMYSMYILIIAGISMGLIFNTLCARQR